MKHTDYSCDFGCPVEAALEVIGGKWKGVILYHLLQDKKRFNELRKLMPKVTQRMLTKQLRDLESDQVITRTVFPEVPPKVVYEITEFGKSLGPVVLLLQQWGSDYLETITEIRTSVAYKSAVEQG
jgi:DNA-binding HxlR family transcriptional regulator